MNVDKEKVSSLSSLLNEAEEIYEKPVNNNVSSRSSYGREVEDFEIHYEISPEDNILVSSMKAIINKSNITKKQLYKAVGRQDGYNLWYSLLNGTISWKRVEIWCNVLGVEPIISFKKT